MDKAKLIQLIKGNYYGNNPEELIEWIASSSFESDLNHYIEEDLLNQLKGEGKNSEVDLTHLIDEILAIAKLQNMEWQEPSAVSPEKKFNGQLTETRKGRKSMFKMALKIAASVALIVAAIFVYQDITQRFDPPQLSSNFVIKENPKGRKSTIFLKDGSKVILNSESSIAYDENFYSGSREILLTGEAFFEVAENPHKPFIVKSGEISTTALGTSFNVRNYDGENVFVSLVTGKVKVDALIKHSRQKENILLPGEKIKFIRNVGEFEKLKYNDSEDFLWKDGILSFNQLSVPSVFARIERWYGVDIQVDSDDFKAVSYGGIFKDQSLEQVLEAIGFTLNFEYSIDNKKVQIKFNK